MVYCRDARIVSVPVVYRSHVGVGTSGIGWLSVHVSLLPMLRMVLFCFRWVDICIGLCVA